MRVKDLLDDLNRSMFLYKDFLDWEVAVEQHPNYMGCCNCNKKEDYLFDDKPGSDPVLYIKSHAGLCCGIDFTEERVYGINIHY